jgi:hypothetical protein
MSLNWHNHEVIKIINDNKQSRDFISEVKKYIMNFYNMVGIVELYYFHMNLAIDGKKAKNAFKYIGLDEDDCNPEEVKESHEDIDMINRMDEFTNIEIDLEYSGEFRTFNYLAKDYFRLKLNDELCGKITYRSFERGGGELSQMYVFEENNGELVRGFIEPDTDLELIEYGDDWIPERFYFEVYFDEKLTTEVVEELKEMTEVFHSYFTTGLNLKVSRNSLLIQAYHIQNILSLDEILTIYEKLSLIDQYTSKFLTSAKPMVEISFTQIDNDWIELDIIYFPDKLQLFVLSMDGYAYNEFENNNNSIESEGLFEGNVDLAESSEFDLGLDSERVGTDDFTDKNFVLTSCEKEKTIVDYILNKRGSIKSSITKKVHYLIYGSVETKKYTDALELQNKGSEIKLISEKTFFREFNIKPKKEDSQYIETNIGNVLSSVLELYMKQGESDISIPKVHLEYYMGRENRYDINRNLQILIDKGILKLSKNMVTIENIDKLKEYAQINDILSLVDEYAKYYERERTTDN